MRVFAKYFEDCGLGFRTNTILQFGNSTDVIGAAFLINPGSAKPLTPITNDFTEYLSKLTRTVNKDWYEFSADSTMRWLALFNCFCFEIKPSFSSYHFDSKVK